MEPSSTGRSVVPFLAGMDHGQCTATATGRRQRSPAAFQPGNDFSRLDGCNRRHCIWPAMSPIPVALAVLLALLLRPVLRRLRKLHWPDTLSSFVIVAIVALIFVGGMSSVAQQGQAWLAEVAANGASGEQDVTPGLWADRRLYESNERGLGYGAERNHCQPQSPSSCIRVKRPLRCSVPAVTLSALR